VFIKLLPDSFFDVEPLEVHQESILKETGKFFKHDESLFHIHRVFF